MARTGLQSIIRKVGSTLRTLNHNSVTLATVLPAPVLIALNALEAVYNLLVALRVVDEE